MTVFRQTCERELVSALIDAAIVGQVGALAEVGAWFQTEWILDPFLRDLAKAVLKLSRERRPICQSSLAREVFVPGRLYDQVELVGQFIQNHYGWHHLPYHARRVHEEYRRLRATEETMDAAKLIQDGNSIEEGLGALREIHQRHGDVGSTRMRDNMEGIQAIIDRMDGKSPPGLGTGIPAADRILGGVRPGNLVVVGAITSAGKSSFLCHLSAMYALQGKAVTYHSLEMASDELQVRWASWYSGYPIHRRREFLRGLSLVHAYCKEGRLDIYTKSFRIAQIEMEILAASARHNLGAAFVDYLQLVTGAGSAKDNRERVVADVTRRLKLLAGQCGIPIFCAAQLNREANERPRINHLRESGAIEQDSNVVILLDPAQGWQDQQRANVDVIVAKNRNGAQGVAQASWIRHLNRYQGRGDDHAAWSVDLRAETSEGADEQDGAGVSRPVDCPGGQGGHDQEMVV